MQQRSGKHYLQAKQEYIDTGKLGKITLARTWWHGNYVPSAKGAGLPGATSDNLNWAHFLGPLQWRDWDPQQYWNWRAYWISGRPGDGSVHPLDRCSPHVYRPADSRSATAAGGVYHYKDGRTAPDTINVLLEYPTDFTATFDATLGAWNHRRGGGNVRRQDGSLYIDRKNTSTLRPERMRSLSTVAATTTWIGPHHELPGVRRSRKLPNGDVLIGHRSAQASHLGNIAYMEKRRLAFDTIQREDTPL